MSYEELNRVALGRIDDWLKAVSENRSHWWFIRKADGSYLLGEPLDDESNWIDGQPQEFEQVFTISKDGIFYSWPQYDEQTEAVTPVELVARFACQDMPEGKRAKHARLILLRMMKFPGLEGDLIFDADETGQGTVYNMKAMAALLGVVHDVPVDDLWDILKIERPTADPLDVDGLLSDFIEYATKTAEYPRPELALGAGLAMLGAVMGRKVVGPTGLATNVYAVGIAPSSAGKDSAASAADQLLISAGLEHVLSAGDYTSDSAVEAELMKHPSMLAQIDEIGHILEIINNRRAASHEKRLTACLMKLFSAAPKTYRGKAYAPSSGVETAIIQRPNLCLYGTTTPTKFFEAMGMGNVATGDLPRWLMFMPRDMAKHRNRNKADILDNEPLAAKVRQMYDDLTERCGVGGLGGSATSGKPVRVGWTPEAERLFDLFRDECDDAFNENPNDPLNAITGRYAEHALKIATIRAVGRDWQEPTITNDDARWAISVAQWCGQVMRREIEKSARSETHKRVELVEDSIRSAGKITSAQLTLALKDKMKAPEIREIVDTLIEAGQVQELCIASGSPGRKPKMYVWKGEAA